MARGTSAKRSASDRLVRAARSAACFGAAGQGLVGRQDEGAQEGVTPVEVAVEGRRGHAQFPGDGAQRQGGGSVSGQLRPGRGRISPVISSRTRSRAVRGAEVAGMTPVWTF